MSLINSEQHELDQLREICQQLSNTNSYIANRDNNEIRSFVIRIIKLEAKRHAMTREERNVIENWTEEEIYEINR